TITSRCATNRSPPPSVISMRVGGSYRWALTPKPFVRALAASAAGGAPMAASAADPFLASRLSGPPNRHAAPIEPMTRHHDSWLTRCRWVRRGRAWGEIRFGGGGDDGSVGGDEVEMGVGCSGDG